MSRRPSSRPSSRTSSRSSSRSRTSSRPTRSSRKSPSSRAYRSSRPSRSPRSPRTRAPRSRTTARTYRDRADRNRGYREQTDRERTQSAQNLSHGRAIILVCLITVLAVVFAFIMAHEHSLAVLRNDQASEQQHYDFNPGRIVSDKKFFDSSSMTSTSVQAFLNKQGANCTDALCLRSAAFATRSVKQDAQCNGYEGGGKQSAAQIIDQTARSCRVSQRTLLVMLEKEQGLIRTTQPTKRKYAAAMGLSCPDHARCDATYSGFFNQVYGAASRLRYYKDHPDRYMYHSGRVNTIAYSPDSSCGTGRVYIENTATALLYIYTPYQPNKAALTSTFGDRCSSFGNLNFSRLWNEWFGSTQ